MSDITSDSSKQPPLKITIRPLAKTPEEWEKTGDFFSFPGHENKW